MSERLEEIYVGKTLYKGRTTGEVLRVEISKEDCDFLIKQAERAEELEKRDKEIYHEAYEQGRFDERMDSYYQDTLPLEEQNQRYKQRLEFYKNIRTEQWMKVIDRYKQALEFYADEDNYEKDNFNMFAETPLVKYDKGEKARQALKGVKE